MLEGVEVKQFMIFFSNFWIVEMQMDSMSSTMRGGQGALQAYLVQQGILPQSEHHHVGPVPGSKWGEKVLQENGKMKHFIIPIHEDKKIQYQN